MRYIDARQSYDVIWREVIDKEIGKYQSYYKDIVIKTDAQEKIWEKYIAYNLSCKERYMVSPNGKLDRHKVSACYMAAILEVRPMKFGYKDELLAGNERLAITVGLSLVRAFAISAIEKKHEEHKLTKKEADILKGKFEDGIKIPDGSLVNHGEYLDNFSNELYYIVKEKNLNILSLAHELYLLEVITRLS